MWTFLLTVACGSEEAGSDSLTDTATDLGEPSLYNWGDGVPTCNWFYAAGPLGGHALYIADIQLPQSDFDAGADVAYDRSLNAGEVELWFDDEATATRDLFICNDNEMALVGRQALVVSGRVVIDATATGPDELCGSPQTFDITWTLSELVTADGPVDDIGPNHGRAGFFGGCYG